MKSPAAKPAPGARPGIEGGVAVLVVSGALLRVAQCFVSFAQFLELFFGGMISRIFVGMIFDRQFAVGLLDLLLAGGALHAKYLVIVAFGHRGQEVGLRETTTLAGRIRRSFNL